MFQTEEAHPGSHRVRPACQRAPLGTTSRRLTPKRTGNDESGPERKKHIARLGPGHVSQVLVLLGLTSVTSRSEAVVRPVEGTPVGSAASRKGFRARTYDRLIVRDLVVEDGGALLVHLVK